MTDLGTLRFPVRLMHALALCLVAGALSTVASAQTAPSADRPPAADASATGQAATPKADGPSRQSEQAAPGTDVSRAGQAPAKTDAPAATAADPAATAADPATASEQAAPGAGVTATGQAETPKANGQPTRSEQTVAPDAGSLLPKDLTPWGMFLSADIVVKAVMVGLAFASLVTWTIALAKGLEVLAARRRLRRELRVLTKAPALSEADRQLGRRASLAALLRAALAEVQMSADTADRQGIKERIALILERLEAAAGRRMTRGTGVLATIGATAPFVGLFGTVWGIMNSFIGISRLHTTNLAVVAPGIAEALLATALGLLAAIPAVVIYNMFSRSIAAYRALYGDATAEVLRLASRDLDREAGHPAASASSAEVDAPGSPTTVRAMPKSRSSATLSAAE
jgi:biopolymer transport protein ExbB